AGFDSGEEHAERSALFGIQQGALHEDLRAESAAALQEIGFDGYAIGGLAVGEGQEAMFAVLDYAPGQLPADRPRYLMGVGKPDDLVGAVMRGVDMFDCVLPSRSGRNGQGFTWTGPVNLRNARHAEDSEPLDERCPCDGCTKYSRAYLHHLIKSGEILGAMLLTEHNLTFYQQLMGAMRAAIGEGLLAAFAQDFLQNYLRN
ncbi:MAG: tRNA-guanine transglycosylase, partial [Novosphingobium sp.]